MDIDDVCRQRGSGGSLLLRPASANLLQIGYSFTMATTTIQVSRDVRDHLAELAKERGLSLGQLIEVLAAEQPTAAQRAKRLAADRDAARRLIGIELSDEEFDQAPDVLGNIYKIAAMKARAARGTAA
ncbi:hypothetical protein ABZV67_25060 [Streptomyces sp. NPDC005065]|uniref:hypothetical protein n=1 Tax=unclassified Streptomyces TaxID=2593676 RepID=UPI00339DA987